MKTTTHNTREPDIRTAYDYVHYCQRKRERREALSDIAGSVGLMFFALTLTVAFLAMA